MPINGYYTTAEAAQILGLTPGSVRGAVTRGTLAATKIAHRSLVSAAELERYQREVQGTQGWQTRRQPGYVPNAKMRPYQRTYYERRKAARQQQPAAEPQDPQEATR
jgi:excisionase family DNA binding protein